MGRGLVRRTYQIGSGAGKAAPVMWSAVACQLSVCLPCAGDVIHPVLWVGLPDYCNAEELWGSLQCKAEVFR